MGMLTAAVCGDIFASPASAAVLAAIRHVTGPAGALLIVKNCEQSNAVCSLICSTPSGHLLAVPHLSRLCRICLDQIYQIFMFSKCADVYSPLLMSRCLNCCVSLYSWRAAVQPVRTTFSCGKAVILIFLPPTSSERSFCVCVSALVTRAGA